MTKQELINLIKSEEKQLHETYRDLLDTFGSNDKATETAATRWATISFLIDKINEHEK